jgi:ACS family hexuronate transporter-like MFS transporter
VTRRAGTPAPGADGIAPATETGASVEGRGALTDVEGYRWVICALLFFAATVNYMDRQVLGLLKPNLQAELGWDEIAYSNVVFWFQAAYAVGLVAVGRLMDGLGMRLGLSLAVSFWSLAAMAHALASSVATFSAARFALGLGEAGYFPAAIKTVTEWFPKRERALATGIFNSGTNVGAVLTPLAVPWIVGNYGWRWAFIVTGATGFVWLLFWWLLYRNPRVRVAEAEGPESTVKVPWRVLLARRQTWAVMSGKFLTDPVWWFYLFWIPGFLHDRHGLPLDSITSGLPIVVIYLAADVGSVGGGWLSSSLIRRGWSVNAARKTAMFTCAACVVPVVFASQTSNMWVAVALIGLATAAHQGWSANIYTTASDMFPKRAIGSVIGLAGFAGAVGGMLIAKFTGYVLDATGNYLLISLVAGSAYLVALLVIHLLVPRLEPAEV